MFVNICNFNHLCKCRISNYGQMPKNTSSNGTASNNKTEPSSAEGNKTMTAGNTTGFAGTDSELYQLQNSS